MSNMHRLLGVGVRDGTQSVYVLSTHCTTGLHTQVHHFYKQMLSISGWMTNCSLCDTLS